MEQKVITFYRFAEFPDHREWKPVLEELGKKEKITGSLILAEEGINATLSGSEEGLERFVRHIEADDRFSELPLRSMTTPRSTFYRLRIVIRREIVTLGDPSILPSNGSGTYIEPEDWNGLISDPEVEVVDVRNDYEVEIGTFEGAVNPKTQTFGQWADFVKKHWGKEKKKKIAMYCTGGIRCEKASAQLVQNGFEQVYHLRGGILHYLEKMKEETSKWKGECFVFDHRVSVIHGLLDGKAKLCFSCRWPLDDDDFKSPEFEEGVSCPRCARSISPERRAGLRERQRQIALAQKRNTQHIGKEMPAKHKKTARPCTHQ
ncbi:rhodanese-related sulfurtransferase [Opitutales bacterium]|nr:rhodanese-related sulfurtransferase [Opitutales bacterium]